MARINIVTPGFSPTTFSGGMWCLLEYASGLAARGHEVTVVPVLPCRHEPRWFPRLAGNIVTSSIAQRCRWLGTSANNCLTAMPRWSNGRFARALGELASAALSFRPGSLPEEIRIGVSCHYLKRVLPEADVTLATAYSTALPARLCGSGRLLYFMQHFEPYFFSSAQDELFAKAQAEMSYRLGLEMIANSSWLKGKVEAETPGSDVHLCPNAIDHSVFHGVPREAASGARTTPCTTVISYSGNRMLWKGFREMAEAVQIARKALRGKTIRWLVYGPAAALPPENLIAEYDWLGFLQPPQLAEAYRSADLLLSASWHESFPLFPLEAMACGLPVITTAPGTEDYAIAGETAEVVAPRDPRSIACGLIRLIRDSQYSRRIARGGKQIAKQFTWEKSVSRMEEILLGKCSRSFLAAVPLRVRQ